MIALMIYFGIGIAYSTVSAILAKKFSTDDLMRSWNLTRDIGLGWMLEINSKFIRCMILATCWLPIFVLIFKYTVKHIDELKK